MKVTSVERRARDRFVATLLVTSRELASGELLYSMGVGSVIEVRDGFIVRNHVFPSPGKGSTAAETG